jgi:hypothetical protein
MSRLASDHADQTAQMLGVGWDHVIEQGYRESTQRQNVILEVASYPDRYRADRCCYTLGDDRLLKATFSAVPVPLQVVGNMGHTTWGRERN